MHDENSNLMAAAREFIGLAELVAAPQCCSCVAAAATETSLRGYSLVEADFEFALRTGPNNPAAGIIQLDEPIFLVKRN